MRTLIHDEFGTLENSFDCPEVNFANSIAVNDFKEIFITDNRCHCVKVGGWVGCVLTGCWLVGCWEGCWLVGCYLLVSALVGGLVCGLLVGE